MLHRITARDWQLAAQDFARGTGNWSIWVLLGISDIRQRYRRSRLGQFWITLSTSIFILGIGLVYGVLFKVETRAYIPFLAVNMIVWTLMTGIVTDGAVAFVQASAYLRQDALPKTIFVMRVLVRNLTAFGHNLIIIPPLFLFFGIVPSPVALLAIPGLALSMVAAFLLVLACGILCTRFRDLPQIMQALLQIAFFLTPVMWAAEQMGDAGWYLARLNPFAIFLWIVAEPIHGRVPDLMTYLSALGVIAGLFMLTWPLFARYRARIVYWL